MEDKYYSRFIKILIFIIDIYFIQIVFSLAYHFGYASEISQLRYTSFALVFSLTWIIAGLANETYRITKFSMLNSIVKNLLSTVIVHIVLVSIIVFLNDSYRFNLQFFSIVYILTTALIIAIRMVYKLTWKYFEFAGIDQRKVIIVGATRSGKALYDFFKSHDYSRYLFKGFFDDNPDQKLISRDLVKGNTEDIINFCKSENIEEIYFALPLTCEKTMAMLAQFADDNFIYLRIVPDISTAVREKYNVFLFDSVPVFTPRNEPLGISLNAGLKRMFDIVFSLLVIVAIFPIAVPLIAIAIRLDSKGPVIFRQMRRGKKNKLFECYKFRTMQIGTNSENQTTRNDPRITRVGKFLRKSNLDELPQFVNVLLGNMSVVGPRPHISKQDEYAKIICRYQFRYFVTPGITGYAQVNGFRGETKEPSLMEKRVEYDLKYMENWSFSFDLKIILQTIWLMFRGQNNAY